MLWNFLWLPGINTLPPVRGEVGSLARGINVSNAQADQQGVLEDRPLAASPAPKPSTT
jgi:hypothetical protein